MNIEEFDFFVASVMVPNLLDALSLKIKSRYRKSNQ